MLRWATLLRFAGKLIHRIRVKRAEVRAAAAPTAAGAAKAAATARRAERMAAERVRLARPPQRVGMETMDTEPPGSSCVQMRARGA